MGDKTLVHLSHPLAPPPVKRPYRNVAEAIIRLTSARLRTFNQKPSVNNLIRVASAVIIPRLAMRPARQIGERFTTPIYPHSRAILFDGLYGTIGTLACSKLKET
jgi:hypothetical protein